MEDMTPEVWLFVILVGGFEVFAVTMCILLNTCPKFAKFFEPKAKDFRPMMTRPAAIFIGLVLALFAIVRLTH